ncbi:MAG: ATPase, partial [Acidobacteria bacterium]|nr:ATPase [Acidobacteriota bacterium]
MKKHIVCIASFFKGNEFFEECYEHDWQVTLVTRESLLDEAWAWTSLSDVKFVREDATAEDYIRAVTNLAGTQKIEKIVGIDEFDVLTAAKARDHLQIEGMSSSFALRFRDKLRMRRMAWDAKIPCPEFTGVFYRKDI